MYFGVERWGKKTLKLIKTKIEKREREREEVQKSIAIILSERIKLKIWSQARVWFEFGWGKKRHI